MKHFRTVIYIYIYNRTNRVEQVSVSKGFLQELAHVIIMAAEREGPYSSGCKLECIYIMHLRKHDLTFLWFRSSVI